MFKKHACEQRKSILQVHWILTGDPLRPLRSSWSLETPYERPALEADRACEVCNTAVMERCETPVIRAKS